MKIDYIVIPFVIATIVVGFIVLLYCAIIAILEYQGQLLLEELNEQSLKLTYNENLLTWDYEFNMTDDRLEKQIAATAEKAQHARNAWVKVSNLPFKLFSNRSLVRQLEFYANPGNDVLDEEKFINLTTTIKEMSAIFSTAEICPMNSTSSNDCTLMLDPDLTDIFETSRNPDELKHVWLEFRNAIGPKCRSFYPKLVALSNEAARLNGFLDRSDMLLSEYEHQFSQIDNLWDQVKPLYVQLHAYIRTKLREKYGNDIVSSRGPIPAHLLGNMWAQSWDNVAEFSLPYPNVEVDEDLTKSLKEKSYSVTKMFEASEDFYVSINLTKMPDSFWKKSILVRVPGVNMTCHASAWDFYHETDVRISICTQVNAEDFVTIHHEMGHLEYFLQYSHQPFPFRNGANPGFHEAIGDLIALSVQSTKHLRKIGMFSQQADSKALLNNLFKLALFQVAFLPFAYLTDVWRFSVYTGETSSENYNCQWWALREKYQGMEPPVVRSEKDFDPAAKYHIVSDDPYLSYFVAMFLQYQFHLALCKVANEYEDQSDKLLCECDIYQNKEAGTLLKEMLAMGSSLPWPEALEVVTGQREMDASGLLEYFKPLHDWLVAENKRTTAFIGWDPSDKVCSSDMT